MTCDLTWSSNNSKLDFDLGITDLRLDLPVCDLTISVVARNIYKTRQFCWTRRGFCKEQ